MAKKTSQKEQVLSEAFAVRKLLKAMDNENFLQGLQNLQNAIFRLNSSILHSVLSLKRINSSKTISIQPLWVEAYFCTPSLSNCITDCCDGEYVQTLENVLYSKKIGNSRGSRFDLCLGEKSICLSILIKYYRIFSAEQNAFHQNDLFCKEKQFKSYLYEIDYEPSDFPESEICPVKRKGISIDNPNYENLKFGAKYKHYKS